MFFLYKYVFSLGFLDGVPGLIYCAMQRIQFFHIKAKIYELQINELRISESRVYESPRGRS